MDADDRTVVSGLAPTVRMPAPGGQATVTTRRVEPTPQAPAPTRPGLELQRLVAGLNPLLGAAGVLLGLIPRLRATTAHPDPAGLRRQLLAWIAQFEALAGAQGVARPKIAAARYVLCTFLDEVIAQTPWGAGSEASERTLLLEFHEERWGGEKAFQLLERLVQEPESNRDLLELFDVCLALGFEGRYRGTPDGAAQLQALAARVHQVVGTRDAGPARRLAARWRGLAAPDRGDVAALPLWVVFAVAAALVVGLWLALNARLDADARPVFRSLHAAPAALRVAPPALAARPRLAGALEREVRRGLLEVRDEAARSLVRLPADALFVPGSAQLRAEQADLLAPVARALQAHPGQVAVIGHADDAPVASLQFPSAWHLTRARAQAVAEALRAHGLRADRVRAEGRADAEPLVAATGAAERARNRRIEIELRLPRPEE